MNLRASKVFGLVVVLFCFGGCASGPQPLPQQPPGPVTQVEWPKQQQEFLHYKELADKGDADAEYRVGLMYASGYGIKRDYLESREWIQKASDGGNQDAQTDVASRCISLTPFSCSYAVAFDLLNQAVEGGGFKAEVLLAMMYEHGLATPVNHALAQDLMDKAARQRDTSLAAYAEAARICVGMRMVITPSALEVTSRGKYAPSFVGFRYDTATASVADVVIVKSSSSKLLDDWAIDTVNRAFLPPPPSDLTDLKGLTLGISPEGASN